MLAMIRGFVTPKEDVCFWRHHWGKWEDPFTGEWVKIVDGGSYGSLTQKRTCKRCNAVSYRKCT